MAFNPNNTNGQGTMATSAPVVIASNQSTIPVRNQDNAGVGIDSLSAGAGANGLLTAQGATNFFVSTANSSTAQLTAGATFNGTIESVLSAPYASIVIDTDQPGTLIIRQYVTSLAGSQIISTTFSIPTKTAGSCFGRSFPINGNFLSISYTNNGLVATTTLNINVAFGNINATTQLLNMPVSLNEINGTALTIGQGTMAASLPVTIASNQNAISDTTSTGNITIVNANPGLGATAGSAVSLAINGQSAASIQISGTWVATLQFEASVNGVDWVAINGVFAGASTPGSTISANGLVRLTPGGVSQIRIVATAFTSGTAVISMRASVATGGTFLNQSLTAGTNTIGTVNHPTLTKGTQGPTGITTQDLKDAGRNAIHFYTLIPVLSSATDTLQSLTGTKGGATITATTTPAVVTAGKVMRITRVAATYVATAASGYGIVRLRFNTAGVVAITSPIAATLLVGSGAPTTANSTASEEATLDEGWEFAAATGIGISVQGFAAATPTAVGYVLVSVTGYEY